MELRIRHVLELGQEKWDTLVAALDIALEVADGNMEEARTVYDEQEDPLFPLAARFDELATALDPEHHLGGAEPGN